jgi:hypothetical protein
MSSQDQFGDIDLESQETQETTKTKKPRIRKSAKAPKQNVLKAGFLARKSRTMRALINHMSELNKGGESDLSVCFTREAREVLVSFLIDDAIGHLENTARLALISNKRTADATHALTAFRMHNQSINTNTKAVIEESPAARKAFEQYYEFMENQRKLKTFRGAVHQSKEPKTLIRELKALDVELKKRSSKSVAVTKPRKAREAREKTTKKIK